MLHNFGNGLDGSGPNGALILDSAGNIFGTTGEGGTAGVGGTAASGTVFELSPGSGGEWMESLAAPSNQLRSKPRYFKPFEIIGSGSLVR